MGHNLILIGLPTAGKSTLGVVLAKMLGYDYIDTDLLIQKREGCRLEEIIRRIGDEAFLDLEAEVCTSLAAEHTVIATGGSVIYRVRAMEHLKELGTVIYLKISLETLQARMHDAQSRGVVIKEGQTIEGLYHERVRRYEQYADLIIDEGNLEFEEVIDTLIKAVRDGAA